jgi:hypothetical protein
MFFLIQKGGKSYNCYDQFHMIILIIVVRQAPRVITANADVPGGERGSTEKGRAK